MKAIRKNVARVAPVVLCALALGTSAWAGGDAKFKAMDADGDGLVSATEHAASVTSTFGQMDANGDGKVSAQEMDARYAIKEAGKSDEVRTMNDASGYSSQAPRAMSTADKIAKMDTDGDGLLSSAENDAAALSTFAQMDADGNGSLTHQELAAGHGMKKKP